jgi:hypothetical protein
VLYHYCRAVIFGLAAMTAIAVPAAAERQSMNGIYILNAPADYDVFQLLVKNYRDSGADSIIIKPISSAGSIDKQAIAQAVFFAHDCGLKLFVVLPTRTMEQVIAEHPDWEDLNYNIRTRSIKKSGKLDLFNPSVSAYLSNLFKDIAGYSIDGIILDDDFYYGDTEGLSLVALEQYKLKYGSSFSSREVFRQLEEGASRSIDLYGEGFWNMAELKKNCLLTVFSSIVQETRSVNKTLKFGISVHVPGLFLTEKEVFAWYAHDLKQFSTVNADFFWLAIPHRDIREQQDLNYRKSMEAVSRKATATGTLIKEHNIVIAVQAVSPSGKSLPLSEIEEVSMQVKKAGNPGIAFMVTNDTQLPSILTQKIFQKQLE